MSDDEKYATTPLISGFTASFFASRTDFLSAWRDLCRAGEVTGPRVADEVISTLSAMEQIASLMGVDHV